MSKKVKKVGILTAGGLAPCLSASIGYLIETYTRKAPKVEIICYVNGYMGLLQGKSLKVTSAVRKNWKALVEHGGSPIGNSRVKLTNVKDCVKRGLVKEGQDPQKVAAACCRLQQRDRRRLAFTFEHAIDRACCVSQDIGGSKRSAMATDKQETARVRGLDRLRQIDDFRYVGQIVAGEAHRIGLPVRYQAIEVAVRLHLEIDQTDVVARIARDRRDHFESEWFKAKEHPGVHQAAGMNSKDFHGTS